jgi:hypothetical protein
VRHDGLVVTEALLIWLVTYVSFLAVFGFVFFVARDFSGRRWPDSTILRRASLLAFVGATVFWVLVVIAD